MSQISSPKAAVMALPGAIAGRSINAFFASSAKASMRSGSASKKWSKARGCSRRPSPAASKQRRTSARVSCGVQPLKKWNWSKPPIMQTRSPMRRLASRQVHVAAHARRGEGLHGVGPHGGDVAPGSASCRRRCGRRCAGRPRGPPRSIGAS